MGGPSRVSGVPPSPQKAGRLLIASFPIQHKVDDRWGAKVKKHIVISLLCLVLKYFIMKMKSDVVVEFVGTRKRKQPVQDEIEGKFRGISLSIIFLS